MDSSVTLIARVPARVLELDLTTYSLFAMTQYHERASMTSILDVLKNMFVVHPIVGKSNLTTKKKQTRLSKEIFESLPQKAKDWIHDLETRCDPSGELAELRLLQETCSTQLILIEELRSKVSELQSR